jgi:hypothetical protein
VFRKGASKYSRKRTPGKEFVAFDTELNEEVKAVKMKFFRSELMQVEYKRVYRYFTVQEFEKRFKRD